MNIWNLNLQKSKTGVLLSSAPYFVDWKYTHSSGEPFVAKRAFLIQKLSGDYLVCLISENLLRFISIKNSDFYWEYKLPGKTKLLSNIYFYEDKLVVFSFDNTIFAFDIGKRKHIWSRRFTGYLSFPPLGFKETVLISLADVPDSACPSHIAAISLETGDIAWMNDAKYSSSISVKNENLLYSLEGGIVICNNIKTGEILWQNSLRGNDFYWFSFFGDEVFLLGSKTFRALNLLSGEVIWTISAPMEPTSGIAFKDDILFFVSRCDEIVSVDLHTGKVLWKYNLALPPIGNLQIFIFGNHVMIRKENVFYIFSAKTGKMLFNRVFSMYMNKNIVPQPLVNSDYCFITDGATELFMLDSKTIKQQWKLPLRRVFSSDLISLMYDGNFLILADEDGTVACVNLYSVTSSLI